MSPSVKAIMLEIYAMNLLDLFVLAGSPVPIT